MKSNLIKGVAGLVLLSLLGFLFFKSTSVDAGRHTLVTAQLRQLRQLDALLNQYVLQARDHMINNYDPLVITQRHIVDVLNDMKYLRPDLFISGTPLSNKVESYLKVRNEKNDFINDFKSQNSVLRNSARYFPVVTQEFLEGKGHINNGDPMEVLVRNNLLNHLLIYQITPTEQDRRLITDTLIQIKKKMGGYNSTHRQYLNSIILHTGVLLAFKDTTDVTIAKILNSETTMLGDEIFNLYGEDFEQAAYETNLYRFWLLLFAVVGLVYGGYTLIRFTQARSELNKSHALLKFQQFALDQHSIVSIADRSGRINYVNPKFNEISQYSEEELLGKDHRLLNSGYHPKEFFKNMWATIGAGKVWHGEVRNRKKDGSIYWVDSTVVPLTNEKGVPEQFVSIRTDITDRVLFEETIQNQRDFYERITETLGEGLYVQDKEGICTYMNGEAELLLGWSRHEFIGKKVNETIHSSTLTGELLPAEMDPLATLTQSGKRVVDEGQIFTRCDGTKFPVSVVSQGVFKDGEYQGAVVAFQDITQRKEAATALLKAKETAEQVSQLKSDFLSNMSHEIRTPMNGILGMTDLALDTKLTPEQQEYMGMVKSSATSLLGIINDILDFSKIEAGRLEIDIFEFSLNRMLHETVKSIAYRADQKKLKLLVHVAPDVPDHLMGDAGRIRQILVNLIGNAIKFTEQGEVEVKVRMQREMEEGIISLQFSVRDTGIGIPKEKFHLIFESFSQADTSTTRKYGGTGLGLTISSQLVELMGGRIWLESESGKGSTFFFNLDLAVSSPAPYAENHSAEMPAISTKQNFRFKLKLLLAEDNPVNQTLAVRLLEKHGHQVMLAKNGLEALSCWRSNTFDAILMDVDMPEMNGYEATQSIRLQEQTTGKHIPIVAMTAHAIKGSREKCLQAGMDGYISKPINTDALWKELKIIEGGITRESDNFSLSAPGVVADLNKARELMDNNKELFEEILRIYVKDSPRYLENAKIAFEQGQIDQLKHNVHSIKGMVSVFAAERTTEIAAKIESNADNLQCGEWLQQLEIEMAILKDLLESYQW
jgi:PAS domain S-box-containing protein